MKKILLLSTGGTIASAPGEEGLVPKFTGEEMIKLIPELRGLCHIEYKEILNLDSTNMQPEDWLTIAREAYTGLKEYDGIVITHGTDTMAYTAGALSFMLRGLSKPVVLTGSQVPIESSLTDGKKNIYDAFKVATSSLKGVFVVFNGKIILGTRASKLYTHKYEAFHSINFPEIGYVEGENLKILVPPPENKEMELQFDDRLETDVFLLKIIPGTKPEVFDYFIESGYKGVILEGFGLGGIPYLGRNLLPGLEKLYNHGIATVVTTQSVYDGVDLTVYDVGVKALKTGVIPAYDMVKETVVAKLMWVLGHTRNLEEVRKMMLTNYCGEIIL